MYAEPASVMTTRIGVAGIAAAATVFAGSSGAGATVLSAQAASSSFDGSSAAVPTWSAHWIQANPGLPLVLILNPGRAAICFVGVHGPSGAQPVGWRFQPGGHRLSLTLLTHADAIAGQWKVRASCEGHGSRAQSASVLVSVPAPGGTGPLAAHGDMRVQLLAGS